jgi:hypothetical protein
VSAKYSSATGPVGNVRVTQGHVQAVVPEQGADRLEAHAAVDGLGREGLADLVGVDVPDAGGGGGLVPVGGDAVAVRRLTVSRGSRRGFSGWTWRVR